MSVPANFKTAINSKAFTLLSWLEIEGIPYAFGDVSKTAGWFAARAAADQFLSILPYFRAGSPPITLDSQIDLLNDGIAKTVGELRFELSDIDGFLTTMTGNAKKDDWVYLAADIAAGDATIGYTGNGFAFPGSGTLYIGTETVTYTGHNTGTKQFTGCSRGRYRSKAKAFGKGFPVAPRPVDLKGRRCWYHLAADTATVPAADADRALRFVGTLTNYLVHSKDLGAYVLVVQSLEKALDKKVFRNLRTLVDAGKGMWGPNASSGVKSFADGAKTLPEIELRCDDAKRFTAGTSFLARVDDELVGFSVQTDTSGNYFWLVYRGVFNTLRTDHHAGFTAKEVAWIGPYDDGTNGATVTSATGKFSSAPTTSSPLPAHHPLLVLLQVLLSTGAGTNTPGGGARNYDVLPADWGLGIDYTRVDIAGIEKLASQYPDLRIAGVIESEINFIDFARKLLRPYGFFAGTQIGDLWTIRDIRPPLPDESARTLDASTRINGSTSGWDANLDGVVQEVDFRYAPNLVSRQYTQIAIGVLQDVYVFSNGEGRRLDYEMPWTYGEGKTYGKPDGGGQPNVDIYLQGRADAIRKRYAKPPPVVNERVDYSWLDVEYGELVALTHPQLPDAGAAARGMTAVIGQVIGKREDPRSRSIDLTIELTGYNLADYRFIAPTLEVATLVAADTVTVKDNAFTEPSINGVTQKDWAPLDSNLQPYQCFGAAQNLLVWDNDWSASHATSGNFDPNTKTLVTTFAAYSVGMRVTLAPYDTEKAQSVQRVSRFAYLADAALTLGAGADPAHKYFP